MKSIKKYLALALCVVMLAAALTSCSMVTVNEERDNAQVVAVVNGTEILKEEYKEFLPNYLYNYGMDESSLAASTEADSIRESALDTLIRQELLYQEAEKEGLVDESDENKQEIEDQVQSSMDSMYDYYFEQALIELGVEEEVAYAAAYESEEDEEATDDNTASDDNQDEAANSSGEEDAAKSEDDDVIPEEDSTEATGDEDENEASKAASTENTDNNDDATAPEGNEADDTATDEDETADTVAEDSDVPAEEDSTGDEDAITAEEEAAQEAADAELKAKVAAIDPEILTQADEKANEQLEDYKVMYGYDDMEAYIAEQIRSNAINDMYTQITDEVEFTEEDAKEYYDTQVELQQPLIEEDPSNYDIYESLGTSMGGDGAYVNPAGSRYVKNLLISLPDEIQNEISALRSNEDEEGANALRDEELAKIKETADAALQRINDGEDFDTVMAEVGEDPGMQSDPAMTYGYLVYDGDSFVAEFHDASMALANEGDVSELVPTDFGYHIIKYVKDGEGPVDFEMVKDDIISSQLSSKQNQRLEEFFTEIKEASDIKTYPNRLK